LSENINLRVENLSKDYGSVQALSDLSFSAGKGEILGLLGPNGAGKTTVIHILLGMLNLSGGKIRLFGLCPFRDKYKIYPRINFASAYVNLPFNIKVRQNLSLFAKLYGISDAPARIDKLLSLFQLTHLQKKFTGSLSSGEQTRLNLCKSLLNNPEILFLDEPTASLDPDMAEQVRGILKSIHKDFGTTIIYTSHNMREVEIMCDRILFLNKGRKLVEGTPGEIRAVFKKKSLEEVFIHLVRSEDFNPLKNEESHV